MGVVGSAGRCIYCIGHKNCIGSRLKSLDIGKVVSEKNALAITYIVKS